MANKLKWNNHKSTFFEILKAQRETSKYTDATLAVDGKFYPVHKLVLSTCSEYFSEIFERTACKSPVIVLKDVQSHDIEALLDYIYVGEVDVKQDHLASLLKTANCLRIKGLGVPEEYQTKSHKNSISSHDVAHARPYSPPPKRRKHDSNAALANPNQSPHIPSNTSSNTNQKDESLFVKVEIDDSMEEEVRFIKEDVYEAGVETDHDPGKVSGYDITKKEQEPESYVCTSLPGPSSQQFTSSTSITKQDEFLVVKVGLEAAKEPDLRVSQKHNYDGATSSDLDPLGGDDGSIIFNTEHNQEYYGSTSLPGSYLQQSAVIKLAQKCFKRMKKELDTIPNGIPAAVVIKFQNYNTFTIHSNSIAIKENIEAICDKIENHPAYIANKILCRKQMGELLKRPKVPVNQMNFGDTKDFVVRMMRDIANFSGRSNPNYNKPEFKPEWWPINIRWGSVQNGINCEQMRNILTACFNYYGITLDHRDPTEQLNNIT